MPIVPDVIVTTPLGKVQGYRELSRNGREYIAFSGLPYAQPPLGDLLFKPPQPLEPWNGIKDAFVDGPWCIQYNTFLIKPSPVGALDCLYLSLYTHNVTGKFPVLVRFHGGGFISGNGPQTVGPQYLMDEDVLVVMVNYRVGVYGFLSFEDEIMPGNQGMKDQVMALKWIQKNISSFGGDPNQVTIMGESAGGVSVYHHIISPLSQGLFNKAISQSGTSFNNWALATPGKAKNYAVKLLSKLNYNYSTTTEAVEFLKKKDPVEVVSALELLREWQIDPICCFNPVFETEGPGAFLVWPISKWIHQPVPLLMGMTSAEGLFRTQYFKFYKMDFEWFSKNFEEIAPLSMTYDKTSSKPDEVTKMLRNYYLPKKEISENDWENLAKMYTDAIFSIGILEGANKHPGEVYFYYFDYLGEFCYCGDKTRKTPDWYIGPNHSDELIYLFKCGNQDFTGEDLELSKKMIKIWANFVKNGKPVSDQIGQKWIKWSKNNQYYIHITKDGFQIEKGLLEDRYMLWKGMPFRDLIEA